MEAERSQEVSKWGAGEKGRRRKGCGQKGVRQSNSPFGGSLTRLLVDVPTQSSVGF